MRIIKSYNQDVLFECKSDLKQIENKIGGTQGHVAVYVDSPQYVKFINGATP